MENTQVMETHDVQPVIALRNLTKVYTIGTQKLRALDQVDLDIYPGEFACIIGRSGSGKSTLLNMMAPAEPYDRDASVPMPQKAQWPPDIHCS